ncbi:hypothetical protein BDR22DRAFT_226303 [Usnea florida]
MRLIVDHKDKVGNNNRKRSTNVFTPMMIPVLAIISSKEKETEHVAFLPWISGRPTPQQPTEGPFKKKQKSGRQINRSLSDVCYYSQ